VKIPVVSPDVVITRDFPACAVTALTVDSFGLEARSAMAGLSVVSFLLLFIAEQQSTSRLCAREFSWSMATSMFSVFWVSDRRTDDETGGPTAVLFWNNNFRSPSTVRCALRQDA
jgi:hypothetical protein